MKSDMEDRGRDDREVNVLGKMILPPEMLTVFLLVVVAGSVILHVVANKKWGYTEKRERELEDQPNLQHVPKNTRK